MPVVDSLCKSSEANSLARPLGRAPPVSVGRCQPQVFLKACLKCRISTLDTRCCALWDFPSVRPEGQVSSDLFPSHSSWSSVCFVSFWQSWTWSSIRRTTRGPAPYSSASPRTTVSGGVSHQPAFLSADHHTSRVTELHCVSEICYTKSRLI